jgi:hypothetical protein
MEKTLGEIGAAVIKTINNLLRTSVASKVGSQKWGQSRSQYMRRRGPWRTYSRGRSPSMYIVRYVCIIVMRCYQSWHKHTCWDGMFKMYAVYCTYMYSPYTLTVVPFSCTNCTCIKTGVYFSQVKNKQWILCIYTWSWHCREQYQCLASWGLCAPEVSSLLQRNRSVN